ncbi:MAG TPA: hypothetical protein VGI31_01590 [Streptosporangiaceae bacterium]
MIRSGTARKVALGRMVAVTALASAAALAGGGHVQAASRSAGGLAPAAAGDISTVAGGVGGPAPATKIELGVCSVSYGAGSVYVGAGSTVRAVSPQTDRLTTPAGTLGVGPLANGGPGSAAAVFTCGTATDASGNLLIADGVGSGVRAVAASTGTFYGRHMTKGDIYSIAGHGTPGFSGDGGPATSARLSGPGAVTLDSAGNVLVTDSGNKRIRVIAENTGTSYGQHMTKGDIYTIAGGGHAGLGDGGPATSAQLNLPEGVTVDSSGNVLIADMHNFRIRVVAVSTGTFYGVSMTAGDIYTIAGTGQHGFSGDGGPASSAELNLPRGVTVDNSGNVLIADMRNNRIRVVAQSTGTFYGVPMTAGDIYTIAGGGHAGLGDHGPATSATLDFPENTALDGAGNLLIADSRHQRVRVVAASSGTFYSQNMTAGDIYTIAGDGAPAIGYCPSGCPATSAQLGNPIDTLESVIADGHGNLLIADLNQNAVRAVAGQSGTFYGHAMTAGDIYTIAGTGQNGFSGDGGPATQATFEGVTGVALDHAGNVLVTDEASNRIRVVAEGTGTFYGQAMTAGDIYTIAGGGHAGLGDGGPATSAELFFPQGLTVDGHGNVLITDRDSDRIRVVAEGTGTFYGQAMTAGDIYTIAGNGSRGYSGDGGPATGATFTLPQDVALDSAGNVLIGDTGNNVIRVVAESSGTFYGVPMTAGDIYTIAGNGTGGYSGDGGPATAAELSLPFGVAADAAGNALIGDTDNNAVRVVAESSGTFYGVAMTAGDIYTIAGNGTPGFSGDGGPASSAEVASPGSIAVDNAGDLLIADNGNARIREITG